jgi:hypothetical protein
VHDVTITKESPNYHGWFIFELIKGLWWKKILY